MPVLSTDTARLNGMPKPSAATTPFHLVYGGDSYLNDQTVRDLKHEAQRRYPDAETIELDAANADHYAFDEAVSPSLLADRAIVIVTNLQNADEKLGDAMVSYCRQACKEPADACIVICQHEGGVKGKRLVEQLTKAGAYKDAVADLKKPEAKLNFVMQCFERRKRRVEPMAAQQLVAVLGDRTGELAAMVGQLCFDFDDNPMTLDRVNQYLTSNPQVDGFRVADLALSGRTADAIIAMRCVRGTGHRSDRADRRAGHEAADDGEGVGGACGHHFHGRGENEPLGVEERDPATIRMDVKRHERMHPDARMGRRAKQN